MNVENIDYDYKNGVLVQLNDEDIHKLKIGYDKLWDVCNQNKDLDFEGILSFLDLVISEVE